MAYLIVNSQNQLYKIASNDTEKNNQNCTIPPYSTIEISDADFLKIKQNLTLIFLAKLHHLQILILLILVLVKLTLRNIIKM